jgi:hypothetical protein
MARRPRQDTPGSWYHVDNRGIAKRPLFEDRADIRFFLSRLAREVRKGRIELHAYSILITHFHLLLRSPLGEMSEALRQAQNAHSRRFNRNHRRDGALVRGRFFSRPVDDDRYWRTLVCYIDHNPERAEIVPWSGSYEFGSAYHYQNPSGPPWLMRSRVEGEACRMVGASHFGPEAYAQAFGNRAGVDIDELMALVERRMNARTTTDPLKDLVGSTPLEVQRWMQRKTRLADGHRPGLPVCTPASLTRALANDGVDHGTWMVEKDDALVRALPRAFNNLAHDLGGLSWRELSKRQSQSPMRCRRLAREHQALVKEHDDYRVRTARVVQLALEFVLGR